ncbi:alpha/beta fold hydrolase [Streptomyces mirabilis]|uniref:alpha/beta fold hydrolase n=1 Tax=Streptomyces mirabilis TaxID=68239 RepID=UPI0033BD8E60
MTGPGVVRRTLVVDGVRTSYLEAGEGTPLLLLHGGEFGGGAEVCWEHVIPGLAEHHRVVAPDLLGFGETDKLIDFVDGKSRRLAHLGAFCQLLDLRDMIVVGNSMGGMLALLDATRERPVVPAAGIVSLTGGGRLSSNEHTDALFEYDGSLEGMRRIVQALFADPSWPADTGYVQRRHALSLTPGAWEAIAAARFRRPVLDGELAVSRTGSGIDYAAIAVPTLMVAGAEDKIKPAGWADEVCALIPDSRQAVVPAAGHCPQIEAAKTTLPLILEFAAKSR